MRNDGKVAYNFNCNLKWHAHSWINVKTNISTHYNCVGFDVIKCPLFNVFRNKCDLYVDIEWIWCFFVICRFDDYSWQQRQRELCNNYCRFADAWDITHTDSRESCRTANKWGRQNNHILQKGLEKKTKHHARAVEKNKKDSSPKVGRTLLDWHRLTKNTWVVKKRHFPCTSPTQPVHGFSARKTMFCCITSDFRNKPHGMLKVFTPFWQTPQLQSSGRYTDVAVGV